MNSQLKQEFSPQTFLPNLISGIILGLTLVVFDASLGSLLFSGQLAPYAPIGSGIALFTTAVVLVSTSLTTSVSGVIGALQDSPTVIMAGLVAAVAAALSLTDVMPLLVIIALTTLLTGLFFLAVGVFKLGGLVRFVPYPVVGGFLAGTGWLLARGGLQIMTELPTSLATTSSFFQPEQVVQWLPGVVFALLLFVGMRRFNHVLTMPGIIVGAIAFFYLALLVTGTSIDEARDRGLLPEIATQAMTWRPFSPAQLLEVNWAAVIGQGGYIVSILLISLIQLLLNASALEVALKKDIDLNHELRTAGYANILSGLGGGLVGFHALSLSTLNERMGARGRLSGIIAGAICALMLIVGLALLTYFPKFVLGGLVLFLGLDFLFEWVIEGWSKLSRADYAIVMLILVVIALTDFLIGVGLGLLAAIILFTVTYSRINVVHHALSGAERTSNVECPLYHRRTLNQMGKQTSILELRGFIFFGTANSLLERIKARLADPKQPPVHQLLLDFRLVTGLDSSAVFSFRRLHQLAEAHGITLILTHLSPSVRRQLEQGGLLENSAGIKFFPDLDHGLEWCEDEMLRIEQVTKVSVPIVLPAQLKASGFEDELIPRLMPYLELRIVSDGEYLTRQGDDAHDLYFIEIGQATIYLESDDGQQMRLGTLGMGTLVGELGFYLGSKRTASVVTSGTCRIYRLSTEALDQINEQDPDLAAAFHKYMADLLAERLVNTDRLVEAMSE